METVRASGMVPEERMVGQRRLMVRLTVGSQWTTESRRIPDRTGAFIGNHDIITSWCSDAFYVTEPAMSFQTFDLTLWPPWMQTAYAEGRRGRLPSPAGLGHQALVQ